MARFPLVDELDRSPNDILHCCGDHFHESCDHSSARQVDLIRHRLAQPA